MKISGKSSLLTTFLSVQKEFMAIWGERSRVRAMAEATGLSGIIVNPVRYNTHSA